MDAVDVIAVVGPCAPEQHRYGQRLALAEDRAFIPAREIASTEDAVHEGVRLAALVTAPAGAVIDFPAATQVPELIGAAGEHDGVRLTGIVCVLDASHLLADFARDDFHTIHGHRGPSLVAAPLVLATQIEYASSVVLANWEQLSTSDLSTTMALVSHLSPHARLRLDRRASRPDAAGAPATAFAVEQDRPGWVGLLNDDFDPHMTDLRVSALRYTQLRPFHPGRLRLALDRIADGEFGTVIRSGGFCRFATRPGITAGWEQAGPTIAFTPLHHDDRLEDRLGEDEEPLSFGQDIAFVGIDVDRAGLSAALDRAALSDAELAAGPHAWRAFADPFPSWLIVPDPAD